MSHDTDATDPAGLGKETGSSDGFRVRSGGGLDD